MEIPKRIRYGIDASKPNMAMPYVELPLSIFNQIVDENVIDLPKNKRQEDRSLLQISNGYYRSRRLTILTRRIGRLSSNQRRIGLSTVVTVFDNIEKAAENNSGDDLMRITVSPQRLNDGTRLGLDVVAKWPSPEIAKPIHNSIVTGVMRQVALDVRYGRSPYDSSNDYKRMLDQNVYADIDRIHGVTLETNPLGSCSLGTDGSYYDSQNNSVELLYHNIYGHDQQLILIAGAIAFAHAHEFLHASS